MNPIVYLDGHYVRVNAAVLDFFTPGIFPAEGVFETMRCVDGKIEFLDEHLQRLLAGLKVLRIRHAYNVPALKRVCQQLVRRNSSIQLGRLRVMVFQAGANVHCLAMAVAYQPPSLRQYRQGLKVKLVRTSRPATARFADVKSLDYRLFAEAYSKAKAAGYDEALLLNRDGHVFEASRANVFIVLNGQIFTPPLSSGCLNGIIRQQIIKIARSLKTPVRERNITLAMLKKADKVFLTNSLAGLISVGSTYNILVG